MGFILIFSRSHPLRRVDADAWQLAYVDGGGFGAVLFGFPFLATGPFLVAVNIRLAANLWNNPPVGWQWLLAAAGFVVLVSNCVMFTAFGGWLVFGRRGVVFDNRESTVTLWHSLPFHRRSKEYRLDDYRAISVEQSGGSFRTGPKYSVLLRDGQGSSLIVATLKASQEQADNLANEIASFLDWNVVAGGRAIHGDLQDLMEQKP